MLTKTSAFAASVAAAVSTLGIFALKTMKDIKDLKFRTDDTSKAVNGILDSLDEIADERRADLDDAAAKDSRIQSDFAELDQRVAELEKEVEGCTSSSGRTPTMKTGPKS